jgi:hypothetical protein
MADEVVEVVVKAMVAGVLVVAFAALAVTLAPKQLAGVFSAAPSVALSNMIVTAVFAGPGDVAAAARGMVIGAAGFTVYCLVVVPLVKAWGPWRGSAGALAAWALVVTAGYLLVQP